MHQENLYQKNLNQENLNQENLNQENLNQRSLNKRKEGARYEKLAQEYLKAQGYRILESNFRSRYAEIDVVAREGKYLVFVEVKQRSTRALGSGSEAVDGRKQFRISMAARYYLYKNHVDPSMPVRFDVVSIDRGQIRLIRNAFFYRESRSG